LKEKAAFENSCGDSVKGLPPSLCIGYAHMAPVKATRPQHPDDFSLIDQYTSLCIGKVAR
jgi:hypothetical protein